MPLAASSASGFSTPLAVAAAGTAIAWLIALIIVLITRRPPRVHAVDQGMELPPEPPAVAGLLANDFVVPSEIAPTILLDLAARHIVDLEEVQPGKTICRLREHAPTEALTEYEQRVLVELRDKAIDGVVPTDALTTGPEEQSADWHHALAQEVVDDAQARGLTYERWTVGTLTLLATGLAPAAALFMLALRASNDRGESDWMGWVAGAVAITIVVVGLLFVAHLWRSLAQLPTDAGLAAAARVDGLAAHLRADHELADLPPAAVTVRDRHFAYAAAFGAAPLAVTLLPMGAEDDHRAWSRFGGHWRRVRVRYPRAWPPAWGKHPILAALMGAGWAGIAGGAIYWLVRLADAARPSGISSQVWEWVERGALLAMIPVTVLLVWSIWVLARSMPDLWSNRNITGEIVRARRFRRWTGSNNEPRYSYYLAVDDGTAPQVVAWRLKETTWGDRAEGETVAAVITPRLRYVRSMEPAPKSG